MPTDFSIDENTSTAVFLDYHQLATSQGCHHQLATSQGCSNLVTTMYKGGEVVTTMLLNCNICDNLVATW